MFRGARWAGRAAVVLGLGTACVLGGLTLVGGDSTGTGTSARARGAVAEAAATDPRTQAWNWLTAQLHAPSAATTASSITPAQEYPADWTGPVAGTFALTGVTPPVAQAPAVSLDGPSAAAAADPAFRGTVTGRVTLPAASNRWILQAYRVDGGTVRQAPAQAMAGPDGTFALGLADVGDPGPGRWEVGVLDAAAAYAPTGERWPAAGTLPGWEVRSFAITDRPYLLGSTPARADGSFAFPSSAPGAKMFQLVATGSGADVLLAEYRPATGLIRTPDGTPASATTHTYDQALTLQAALVLGDGTTADQLATGLLRLQTSSGAQAGGFVATAPQGNPEAAAPVYRTGGHAVATYALISAIQTLPAGDPRQDSWRSAASAAVGWLLAQRVTSGPNAGLVTGGWGTDAGAATRIDWISTEHNLDAWHALHLAATALSCGPCGPAADALKNAILQRLWEPTGGFIQGATPDGPDTARPLDVQTWGALWLTKVGRADLAATALADIPAYRVTDQGITGMLAFKAQPAMPNPTPTVWFEGSFGLAMAQARAGDSAAHGATLAALAAGQRPDGSFPVATTADPVRELTTQSSVAATAWFLLAEHAGDPRGLWS